MSNDTISINELATQIGTERVSDWVEVSQEMIDKFADATGDHHSSTSTLRWRR